MLLSCNNSRASIIIIEENAGTRRAVKRITKYIYSGIDRESDLLLHVKVNCMLAVGFLFDVK